MLERNEFGLFPKSNISPFSPDGSDIDRFFSGNIADSRKPFLLKMPFVSLLKIDLPVAKFYKILELLY